MARSLLGGVGTPLTFLAALVALSSCEAGKADVREPVVAGMFYPRDADALKEAVDKHLAAAAKGAKVEGHPVALIAPHAGYSYSGKCAGFAYATVKGRTYRRVVVLAVNHRGGWFRGASILDVGAYRTPLGKVPVDRAACRLLLKHRLFVTRPSAHRREHSLEVQLPFLQRAVGSFKLVPIVIGHLTVDEFATVADELRKVVDDETLVVASSDFTHYGRAFDHTPFRTNIRENIEKQDMGAVEQILKLDGKGFWDYVQEKRATICGRYPVSVLLHLLPRGAKGKLLNYYASGDADKDYRHSVSYAAIVFTSAAKWGKAPSQDAAKATPEDDKETRSEGAISRAGERKLLTIARRTLAAVASARGIPKLEADDAELQGKQGVFVTLHKRGKLRGCIGNFRPTTPLCRTVAVQTRMSALEDRRFRPVLPSEVKEIDIEISVLLPAKAIGDPLAWELGKHGIIVRRGFRQATYLPQVAEHFPNKEKMLSYCCRKAGLPTSSWRDKGTTVLIYEAQVFGEKDLKKDP